MSDIAGRISPVAPSLQYVILKHTGIREPHFDLMFETMSGSQLATWRSPCWPIISRTAITRIGDHRRDYLNIEGELGGDRGNVQRISRGYFNPVHISDGLWRITIRDLVATVELEMTRNAGDQWHVQPLQI